MAIVSWHACCLDGAHAEAPHVVGHALPHPKRRLVASTPSAGVVGSSWGPSLVDIDMQARQALHLNRPYFACLVLCCLHACTRVQQGIHATAHACCISSKRSGTGPPRHTSLQKLTCVLCAGSLAAQELLGGLWGTGSFKKGEVEAVSAGGWAPEGLAPPLCACNTPPLHCGHGAAATFAAARSSTAVSWYQTFASRSSCPSLSTSIVTLSNFQPGGARHAGGWGLPHTRRSGGRAGGLPRLRRPGRGSRTGS